VDLTLAVNALSSELAECATAEDDVPGAGRSARVVRGHGYAGHGAPGEEPPGADEGAARPLEEVFEGMRAQASSTHDVDGRQQLALGTTYLAAGLIDQAVAAYARAAHDPTARLEACSALGEIFEDARDYGPAIEWLERAVDAPDATEEARLSVMRRLAAVLEAADEPARALAVWLEILTSHPDDAEAAARVSQSPPPGAGR
jgi:tetratricopeptide (TPR) repeat protein